MGDIDGLKNGSIQTCGQNGQYSLNLYGNPVANYETCMLVAILFIVHA